MAPISDAVFYRRNNQIQDAIDGQNLKQALQLIEKRMKKGEDNIYMKAWKAQILSRHADKTHHKRGVAETLELCNTEPVITDIDTLDMLHQTLQQMDEHTQVRNSLWEKAAKAIPQDVDIQMRWFGYAFENNDWKSAQKAAMSLQKNFPRDRKYYFWAIFLSHLVATDDASSDGERKLFGTLAYRMISKAADDVPTNSTDLLSHPRAIQTAEEVLLLIKIFESQGRYDEAVKALERENVGLSSSIVQNDQTFVSLKLNNLGAAKLWEEGISFAQSILAVPDDPNEQKALQERDDWSAWNLLSRATRELGNPEIAAETQKFIEKFIEFSPKSRNAHLARMDTIQTRISLGDLTQNDLLSACQEYFSVHKHKLYAFDDIRRAFEGNRAMLSNMVDHSLKCSQDEQTTIVPTINALKLDYCLNISGNESNVSREKIEEFVAKCLLLYQQPAHTDETEKKPTTSSTIESQPRDDLCVLAATSLLCPYGAQPNDVNSQIPDAALVRAAGILERLLLDSPHNYEALLLLVRIYLRLGVGSLALSTFSKMNIKQLQYESVAHQLFTRLATIHPQSAPPVEGAELKDFHPQSAFVQALNFYRNAEVTCMKYRTKGLDHGSYLNVEETIELRRRLQNSICRRMYALDVRRMQRLVGGDPMSRYDGLAQECSPAVDGRSPSAFVSCEFKDMPSVEERLRLGPLPKGNWLASARLTDRLFGIIRGISIQKPLTPEIELPALDGLPLSNAEEDRTDAEKEVAKIHGELLNVALFMAGSKTIAPEQADRALGEVDDWMVSKKKALALNEAKVSPIIANTALCLQADTPTAPTWRYFHFIFTLLETLKALSQLVTLASRKASKTMKLPKERVDRLAALVPEVFESVRANTRELKLRVSGSGLLGSLTDLVTEGDQTGKYGEQYRTAHTKHLDMPAVELFCASLMESWEEALDGVMSVKL